MHTDFRFVSLKDSEFSNLFCLDDSELSKMGAVRMTVDSKPGFPCRVSLEDADIGEEVLLLPYEHHAANSPYRASGPIFVRKTAKSADLAPNEIPEMVKHRLLSLRGYDKKAMMVETTVVEGADLEEAIQKMFSNEKVEYLHIHNAKPGCFNCVVERRRG